MKNTGACVGIAGLALAIVLIAPHHADANWGFQARGAHNPIVAPPSDGLLAAGVTPQAHYVIRGGYVAAGTDMRNKGYGSITIAGIPAKSKVVHAFLYWDILNTGYDPADSVGFLNGKVIVGDLVGEGGDPCWADDNGDEIYPNFAYRADVTSLVKGNGKYNLTSFDSGETDGLFPWDPSASVTPPLAEGATLVVFYYNKNSPALDMVLVEGSDLVDSGSPYGLTVGGFLAADPATTPNFTATYTSFGADGQVYDGGADCAAGKEISFDGSLLSIGDWDGTDGPNQLWDTHTHDVSTMINAGDTSASISYSGNTCDCFVWVGAIVAVSAADTDGDGLLDAWEKNGYTDPSNGKFVDLPKMGAKYDHKDLFVEIDWMDGTYNQKPSAAAIKKVIAAFKNAPVLNPDGKTGVNLHVDYGQGGLFTGGNAIPYQDMLPGVISGDWSTFDTIKAANFADERLNIFHYVIFAHDINAQGTSGISRGIPERDFVVSLGEWTNHVGTTQEQAGTFMHELGHNINLHHGGSDDTNYKPNFLSIMNYSFQTRGLRKSKKDGTFDYSRFLLPALDETNLNETKGLNGGAAIKSYGTIYYCPAPALTEKVVNKANGKIDWNCDGTLGAGVAADINKDGNETTLTSFDDWDNLDFRGINEDTTPGHTHPEQSPQVIAELSHELTVEEDSRRPPSPPADVAQNGNSITWTPVGLEIITAYKIYKVGADGRASLVTTVPSSATAEELDRAAAIVPGGKGARYAVASLDRYGNESELSMVSAGK